MAETNTLAFHAAVLITKVKRFTMQGHSINKISYNLHEFFLSLEMSCYECFHTIICLFLCILIQLFNQKFVKTISTVMCLYTQSVLPVELKQEERERQGERDTRERDR
jgi:hypothetical protein